MTATPALTTALQKQVLLLEDDLRDRLAADPERTRAWRTEHGHAVHRGRTAASWQEWRDDRITQAAVAWVLATVFIRFCEDNELVRLVWIAGPEHRRREALDAQLAYFRTEPEHTDREWLLQAVGHLASLPATAGLVDEHSALHLVAPSGDAASALLAFWRERREDGQGLVHDLTDSTLSTRFLGDLYQDLSAYAKATFALLQTPEFVEEFILDRTLEPALAERRLEGFRMIDPTCGSGHFLLGAFDRLLDRWQRHAPGIEAQALVQQALDAIHGVDLNPFAVAIARFRLTVAAMEACGLRSLQAAPSFRLQLAVGDSLLHGPGQQTLAGDADLQHFAYATEDLPALRAILATGRYDVVVGNPPYVTVKDKVLNQAYRERYATCKGTYALTVPFMERFFGLAKRGSADHLPGWVGQVTSNSFMKREFGSRLVEEFLAHRDLRLVVDSSGAYIPGHGTPTVILVGRNQQPSSRTVRTVLGVRGEPGRPRDAAKGIVWTSISEHVDEPGWDDGWVTVADLDREILTRHPWSLTGGGAAALLAQINACSDRLGSRVKAIGRTTAVGDDDAWVTTRSRARVWGDSVLTMPFVIGEAVRDFAIEQVPLIWWPFEDRLAERWVSARSALPTRVLWPVRATLSSRVIFGESLAARGRPWFDHLETYRDRIRAPLGIAFAFVATHNHFVLDRGGKVFKQSAPVIKLPEGATEGDYTGLLAVLNSSLACFWLKQNSQNKAGGGNGRGMQDEAWEERYEFTGTTLQDYPLPTEVPNRQGELLDSLAQQLAASSPKSVTTKTVPTAEALLAARLQADRLRGDMIAAQEELDWQVYQLYGLTPENMTYAGGDLPALRLGQRAFEICIARSVSAGEEQTAWFARHGSKPETSLPEEWSASYRELVQRRLDLIAGNPAIRLLERPENKRRWALESWDKRQEEALRDWLLDRLEDRRYWFDAQGRPWPRSAASMADEVARDSDLVEVLALWEGRRDVPVTQSLVRLLADQAVPYLASYRYNDSGLRKREAWEDTWALQRREDAGEAVGQIPVPPKYTSADFRSAAYWQARGKLDVPKERFVLYPDAGRETDPTPLLGWAGWDHAQQALALNLIIGEREAEGWDDQRLVPLVAGLAELQPWVEQWHSGIDPESGLDLAAFCREELDGRARQVGCTREQLAAWRPAPVRRGRRPAAR